jgi:hypothetical protein
MQDSVVIVLNGGFGNQLFQLAKAIELSSDFNVSINTTIGVTPRTNSGLPSILDYELPGSISVDAIPLSLASQRVIRFLISTSLRRFTNPLIGRFVKLIHVVTKATFLFVSNQWDGIYVAEEIGQTKIDLKPGKNLVVGYFQTTNWQDVNRIRTTMADLKHKRGTQFLQEYIQKARFERPLILHIRMGDYRNEKSIGMIDENYVELALRYAIDQNEFHKIWLFSDEPEEALSLVPSHLHPRIEVMREVEGSPTLTQEVMRLGCGYVLSNSTFGWWAAYLSRNEPKTVIIPDPWFKKIEEPLGLIPTTWTRIAR